MKITPEQALSAIVEELNGKAMSNTTRIGIAYALECLESTAKELAELKAKDGVAIESP
jgi:hypothetical protein